jgi:hypothetical protein
MFIPPYTTLLSSLGVTQEQLDKQPEVTVSAKLLKLLIQAAVVASDVDESGYVNANPDIREALTKRTIASARQHYVSTGYFEGRWGGVRIDDAWYLKTNPDVAQAVRTRGVASATEHYFSSGAAEFRAPNAASLEACATWKSGRRKG